VRSLPMSSIPRVYCCISLRWMVDNAGAVTA
jgi:hypothetical protein